MNAITAIKLKQGFTALARNAICSLDSIEGKEYTPMMQKGRSETVRPGEASSKFGADTLRLLQRHVDDDFDHLVRCKRAAILFDWIHREPVEAIEKKYSPNPYQGRIGHGDIRRFVDTTRYHLRAAHQILRTLYRPRAFRRVRRDTTAAARIWWKSGRTKKWK